LAVAFVCWPGNLESLASRNFRQVQKKKKKEQKKGESNRIEAPYAQNTLPFWAFTAWEK